jgi:hypothetical protein
LGAEIANVDRMKAINVLFRRDSEKDALGVHLGRQGKLDENAVDIVA